MKQPGRTELVVGLAGQQWQMWSPSEQAASRCSYSCQAGASGSLLLLTWSQRRDLIIGCSGVFSRNEVSRICLQYLLLEFFVGFGFFFFCWFWFSFGFVGILGGFFCCCCFCWGCCGQKKRLPNHCCFPKSTLSLVTICPFWFICPISCSGSLSWYAASISDVWLGWRGVSREPAGFL